MRTKHTPAKTKTTTTAQGSVESEKHTPLDVVVVGERPDAYRGTGQDTSAHLPIVRPSKTQGQFLAAKTKLRGSIRVARSRALGIAKVCGMNNGEWGEMADALGVPVRVLNRWVEENPDLLEAYQRGLDLAIAQLERTAIKRATGYTYQEKSRVKVRDANGAIRSETTTVTDKHILPDPNMLKFLLQARYGERFTARDEPPRPAIVINLDADDRRI